MPLMPVTRHVLFMTLRYISGGASQVPLPTVDSHETLQTTAARTTTWNKRSMIRTIVATSCGRLILNMDCWTKTFYVLPRTTYDYTYLRLQ
jgi:hypothetical protein